MLRRFLPIALLSAVLQLTASFSIALDLVVCSKGSDHVAIELGLADDCCNHSPSEDLDCAKSAATDRCTDTSIVQGSIEPRTAPRQDLTVTTATLSALPATFAISPPTSWQRAATTRAPFAPSPELASRRSIVLVV